MLLLSAFSSEPQCDFLLNTKSSTLEYNDPLTGNIIFHFPIEMTNMLQGLLDLITRREKKGKAIEWRHSPGTKGKQSLYPSTKW